MTKDFPFTTYDFYAYLASGLLFMFITDQLYSHGNVFGQQSYNLIQIILIVASGYIVGQILAIPSSLILENILFKYLLFSPLQLQTGSKKPRKREKILSWLVGRYYAPLSVSLSDKLLIKAREVTGKKDAVLLQDVESIFHPAFVAARRNDDTRSRIDDFRNQYGFSRNICFAALLILLLMLPNAKTEIQPIFLTGILVVAMFIRYIKFYSAFSAEVVRAFAFAPEEPK